MSRLGEYYCKACGERVSTTNEIGLCKYCQDLMEEAQNENKYKSDNSWRPPKEGR